MKTKVFGLLVLYILLFSSGCDSKAVSEKNYLQKIQCEDYNKNPVVLRKLTKDEQLDEFDTILYLLETSYAGIDEVYSKGYKNEDVMKKFESRTKDFIYSDEFAEIVYEVLSEYIDDFNFVLESNSNVYHLGKNYSTYFSDLYFINDNGVFYCYDNVSKTKTNIKYDDDIDKLYRYPSYGNDVYRLGIRSTEDKKTIRSNIRLNDKMTSVEFNINDPLPLHLPEYPLTILYNDESVYIMLMSFENTDYNRKVMEYFRQCFSECVDKKNIIIDLRNNPGGNTRFFDDFLKELTSNECVSNYVSKQYVSHAIYKQMCFYQKKENFKDDKAFFDEAINLYLQNENSIFNYTDSKTPLKQTVKDKNIVFIVNNYTACAAEIAVLHSIGLFSSQNLTVIGDDTAGLTTFGNTFTYKLKKSNIYLQMESSRYTYDENSYNKNGYIKPDYYCENIDLMETLGKIVKDEGIIRTLRNCNIS